MSRTDKRLDRGPVNRVRAVAGFDRLMICTLPDARESKAEIQLRRTIGIGCHRLQTFELHRASSPKPTSVTPVSGGRGHLRFGPPLCWSVPFPDQFAVTAPGGTPPRGGGGGGARRTTTPPPAAGCSRSLPARLAPARRYVAVALGAPRAHCCIAREHRVDRFPAPVLHSARSA
jgi:hypothetical protein